MDLLLPDLGLDPKQVKALVEKPKEINTWLGTIFEVAYALAPELFDQFRHVAYRVFPDSSAAQRVETDGEKSGSRSSRTADALVPLLLGVHW